MSPDLAFFPPLCAPPDPSSHFLTLDPSSLD